MITVILTIHVLIVLALIGVVLLQRSDGSALGIGGGSSGGFMTGAGATDALTRTTSVLAFLFFATSIGLAVFASPGEDASEIIEELTGEEQVDPNATPSTDDLLKTLGGRAAQDTVQEPTPNDVPNAEDVNSDGVEEGASAEDGESTSENSTVVDDASAETSESTTDESSN